MRFAAVFLILIPGLLAAQKPTEMNALNSIVNYGNQSAEEIQRMSQSIITYYSAISDRRDSSWPRFGCPVQQEDYYYQKAMEEGAVLGEKGQSVRKALEELRKSEQQIDLKCKALDTYHKLEDHRKDNYAGGKKLVETIVDFLDEYYIGQEKLRTELEKSYASIRRPHSYDDAVKQMQDQLNRERKFVDSWKYNLNESAHTPWVENQLSESILETTAELKKMHGSKPDLIYPASGMWASFVEGMQSVLALKRSALDNYNHEARKSDQHANETYLDLINHYNGVLVANYNVLLDYANNDKFYGLKAILYVPRLEVRKDEQNERREIVPFKDQSVALPSMSKKSQPINRNEFAALENYVTFINESFRQLSGQRDLISNLSSRAAYFSGLASYAGRGSIQFRHEGFNVPLSYYERAVSESKILAPRIATVLNTRATVLLDILKEVDQIGAALEEQTANRSYEKDGCKGLYVLMERTKVLYDAWDDKKESLYEDIGMVFDSFSVSEPKSSWSKSGTALTALAELDREALFMAKRYYKGESTERPITERIDAKVREVLSGEYENMSGIQKLGRSHGHCPYTPYEDLPKSSRLLSEALIELKPVRPGQTRYQHPYHMMVYHYNDVVRYQNKFSELSAVPILKTVYQPDLFELVYPENPGMRQEVQQETPIQETQPRTKPADDQIAVNGRNPAEKIVVQDDRRETAPRIVRDTVYIERRDTVYITESSENLRSMEGYATNNLVLLLDVSGSMNSPAKLAVLKESVIQLLEMMREEDQISIVVFSGKPRILLKPVSFQDKERITKAIQSLRPAGNTDANAGIRLAYKMADENYLRGGNNRIILATDGEFGINDDSRKLIERFAGKDIFLSVFNFGKATSTSENLKTVAATGKGTYQFISRDNVEINLIREVKARRR